MTRVNKYIALAHKLFDGDITAKELEEQVDVLNLDKKQLTLNFGGEDVRK